jgi:hypothetical protein
MLLLGLDLPLKDRKESRERVRERAPAGDVTNPASDPSRFEKAQVYERREIRGHRVSPFLGDFGETRGRKALVRDLQSGSARTEQPSQQSPSGGVTEEPVCELRRLGAASRFAVGVRSHL